MENTLSWLALAYQRLPAVEKEWGKGQSITCGNHRKHIIWDTDVFYDPTRHGY